MSGFERSSEVYAQAIETAETQFGHAVILGGLGTAARHDDGEAKVILADRQGSREFGADFHPVDLDIRDYPNSAVIGKLLLLANPKDRVMHPAVLLPKAKHPGVIRLAKLAQPYVPQVGVTDGINFGLSVEAETASAGFGGHGPAGSFEGGHFGVVLTSGASESIAHALVKNGDKATHKVLDNRLPAQMERNNIAPSNVVPQIRDIATQQYGPGQRLPLFWHPSLEGETGIARADYPDAARLLLGAGVHALGQDGLDRAKRNVDNAIRGA